VRADNAVLPEYLFQLIRSPAVQNVIEDMQSGSTNQVELSRPAVLAMPVPLPPKTEQRRIVAKLDALTARLARARTELDRVGALVERLRQSAFAILFDASGILHRYGERTPYLALLDFVSSTFYGPRIAESAYVSAGVPTLRTSDIGAWGQLKAQNPPQVRVSDRDMEKWALRDGDLVVTRTGATIGKCALYKSEMGPALPSAYLIRIRLNLNLVRPEYVLLFLLSPSGQEQLAAGRTATAQPNINAKAILGLSLPAPSLRVQELVIIALRSMLARADRLEAEAARARALLDRLEAAILAKAFRGELVPQDPDDEPASLLLDRIRAQRAAAPTARRGRKKANA
jgi:type I restriction enzyme S subunit